MKHIDDFDIMCVGAGPAGSSTWLHLHQYAPALAARTLLVDRAAFPRPKLCGGGVGGWSQKVLDHLAIDLDIPCLFISKVEFRFRAERWIHHSPDQFRMVQRADFDMRLVTSAVRRGLTFRQQEQCLGIRRTEDGLLVRTSRDLYKVKAVVGADGALSDVRRRVLGVRGARLAPTLQITAPVNPPYDPEFRQEKVLIDFSPVEKNLQGYAWHFPSLKNGKPVMNHGIGDARFLPGRPRADLKNLFRRQLGSRQIQADPKTWSSFPSRWFSGGEPLSRPNVLLVGDAAGIEPAFGGGIHMALSYGEIAARTLIHAFATGDFSFRGYRDRVMSHFMGGHIRDCTRLATRIYGGRENPLHLVRRFFTGRLTRPDLLSLLIGPKGV